MKVLFAVNDESISTSIVKKYQKEYKEIISYKNVYYFNAIIKELQRNKSYDRVIISEDLEEFTSSSLEQKDKFIFERLDNISDEAISNSGIDIPIILICSDRRAKGEPLLVKLFSISIYNAILGDDRSIDEVCRLISKPRTKKEAKLYYKIDSEDANYEREKENEVSEVELQNILRHFKRLGKNEDSYVESFKRIILQYNKEQMKLIVAILPENVRKVLKKNSVEYQKLVGYDADTSITTEFDSKKNRTGISKSLKSKPKTGTSEKLLESKDKKLTKPVVVPTTIDKNLYKKIDSTNNIDINLDTDLDDEIDDDVQKILEEKPRRRGRPRKNPITDENVIQDIMPKRRGRPRKNIDINEDEDINDTIEVKHSTSNIEDTAVNILPGLEDNMDIEDVTGENISSEFEDSDNKLNTTELHNENNFNDNYQNSDNIEDYQNNDYGEVKDYFDEEQEFKDIDENSFIDYSDRRNILNNQTNMNYLKKYDNNFDDERFEGLFTKEKKIVSFVGTSKNGTSFLVNNLAVVLSNMGIDTAILDATTNKNSFYIYTKNYEDLRKIASNSFDNLINEKAEGIKVNNNLTVYTTIPSKGELLNSSRPILETLVKKHSLVMIDCDFNTPMEYFDKSMEIYLIQSMDVLTIQPLTEFLRELKIKNILDESKIRIIINKMLRLKGVTSKRIIGGMSKYNDPEMSFMTELFNRNTVKVSAQIPFDEDVYIKYLNSMIECDIQINGYPKEFKQRLNLLAESVYPLLPGKKSDKKNRKNDNLFSNSFSPGMNSTLDSMRRKY